MNRTFRTSVMVVLALGIGWIGNEFLGSMNPEFSVLSTPVQAQGVYEMGSDGRYQRFLTVGDDGMTITVWLFENSTNTLQQMPKLTSSKVYKAN